MDTGRWVRGKARTGEETFVTIDGKETRTRSMKGVDAAVMTGVEYSAAGEVLRHGKKQRRKIAAYGKNVKPYQSQIFLSDVIESGQYGTNQV